MNRKFLLPIFFLALLASCHNPTPSAPGNDSDSLATQVKDSLNAELWAYLYTHEFVSDSMTLTFYGDKGYVNDDRIVDALVVSENEEQVASLVGVSPINGKTVRLAVVRDGDNHSVVDVTDPSRTVFFVEKEVELQEEDSLKTSSGETVNTLF
ncbi:MAG: hypothetical protein J5767_03320 [Paludibacteraceae bacterium]|nr:hypothetical protein [Paludibacteraceae bacterium]